MTFKKNTPVKTENLLYISQVFKRILDKKKTKWSIEIPNMITVDFRWWWKIVFTNFWTKKKFEILNFSNPTHTLKMYGFLLKGMNEIQQWPMVTLTFI